MVEKYKDGTFVPRERHDILIEAIGTKEHGGVFEVLEDAST